MPSRTTGTTGGHRPPVGASNGKPDAETLCRLLKVRTETAAAMRRGICLLNAGHLDEAAATFATVMNQEVPNAPLASLLAACYRAGGQIDRASEVLNDVVRAYPEDVALRIRQALTLWSAGDRDSAMRALREAIRQNPECAELHFQLGTLLTMIENYEEAELRFTQAVNIDRDHVDAAVSLAMCCGLRGAPSEAVVHLQRAQARHPHDARIGLLLAQALQAVRQQGLAMHVSARMFEESETEDTAGIDELSRIIEQDPDFVDAFLAIPVDGVNEEVFAVLLRTIEAALERQPEHAELHFHCGRLLERLGDRHAAIRENERAVQLEPSFTRALIELAKLYMNTDRHHDAATRLEEAVRRGAEYADVYFMLGNLYRDQGRSSEARYAYSRALDINQRYEAARNALASLPT